MQQVLHRRAALTQHGSEDALDASWDDLKSFLACARHRSFRNAADLLGVTSTTLMRRIDRLEERIGCRLFLRDQSGLTISEEGLAMIADLTEMERHAFNIFRHAQQSSGATAGTVRVAVTEGDKVEVVVSVHPASKSQLGCAKAPPAGSKSLVVASRS